MATLAPWRSRFPLHYRDLLRREAVELIHARVYLPLPRRHVGADLITLAAMLRIPVYMHNVAEETLFRPDAWTVFGAQDPMGADFRACANFGPLYG